MTTETGGPRSGHEVLAFLPYYELGTLSEADRTALETHALGCDACFAEIERGSGPSRLLRSRSAEALQILEESRPTKSRGLRFPAPIGRFPTAARWIAAAAAVALAFFAVREAGRPSYRELASYPDVPADFGAVRGPGTPGAVSELLSVGRAQLELARYAEAEASFSAALRHDPMSAEAAYLLGLARARAGHPEAAVEPLRRAREAATQERPRITWLLANACLAAGRLEEARALLRELAGPVDRTGAIEPPEATWARALLVRLPDSP